MRKIFLQLTVLVLFLILSPAPKAQTVKLGVFDMDLMVQAMPGYRVVDSLVAQYETDSLGAEFEYYQREYQRLDSTFKADSAAFAAGKKTQAQLNFVAEDRRKMGLNLVYWQQIAQNKSNNKRNQLSQPLYQVVVGAYKKVLDRKKYTIILKPQTYELGFPIDNVFLAVARELKLSELPQQLLNLGDDPDVSAKQQAKPAAGAAKPKTK